MSVTVTDREHVSVRERLRRAAPALLAVHALRALWALLLLGPVYRELSRALDRSVFRATEAPADAALAIEVMARSGAYLLPGAFVWLGSYVLLGPWLQQLLLQTLLGLPLRDAGRRAARRYPAALALRALALILFALIACTTVLALQQALAWLPANAAVELGLSVASVAGVVGCALLLATGQDLAQAELARGATALASTRSAITACTPRVVAPSVLAVSLAGALAALAELASRVPLPLPYAAGPALVLIVQQALLFAALVVRAAWLLHTLRA